MGARRGAGEPGAAAARPVERSCGDDRAPALGQAFFFDAAFSGNATEKDAIKRESPPARAPKVQPHRDLVRDLPRPGARPASTRRRCRGTFRSGRAGRTSTRWRSSTAPTGRSCSGTVAPTRCGRSTSSSRRARRRMNGNRLRTAHRDRRPLPRRSTKQCSRAACASTSRRSARCRRNGKPRAPADRRHAGQSPEPIDDVSTVS